MSAALELEAHGVSRLRLYTRGECRRILRTVAEANAWLDAQVSMTDNDGTPHDITSSDTRAASLLDSDCASSLYRSFEAKVRTTIIPAVESFWGARFSEQIGTQLVRYQPGGHYVPHTDSSRHGEFARRFLTVVCYLNDDFKGGKTSFPSLSYSATPATGNAIVFPAKFVHCAEPVVAGEKFVLITWLCASPPVRWI